MRLRKRRGPGLLASAENATNEMKIAKIMKAKIFIVSHTQQHT